MHRSRFLFALLLPACGSLDPATKAACTKDADCLDGRVCSAGQCVAPDCTTDADCADTATCDQRVCLTLTCVGDSCSGHGDCEVQGHAVTCACQTGYEGGACAECASGYQPAAGLCVLMTECLPTTCSGRGDCSDNPGGGVSCACDPGYAGERCDECAPDYHDPQQDGTCEPDPDLQLDPTATWPQWGFDDARTSHNPDEADLAPANVATLERKWGIGCDDGYFNVVFQAPVVHGSRLLVSSAGAKLTAYNALNGAVLADYGLEPGSRSVWMPQPTVATDGVVYYLEDSFPTQLYALDADLDMLWQAEIGFELGYNQYATVAVHETRDEVYLIEPPMVGGGKLYAIERATGSIAWSLGPTADVEFAGNAVVLDGDRILARADDLADATHVEVVAVVDPTTPEVTSTLARPAGVNDDHYEISSLVRCGRTLLVTYCDRADVFESEGTLVALDVDSGELEWTLPSATRIYPPACDVAAGQVLVGTDPNLIALDLSTGAEEWRYQAPGQVLAPSVANGVVYILASTNLYAVDQSNGDQLFRYPLGEQADDSTQVAVAGGMLFFSGNGGTCDLYALGLP